MAQFAKGLGILSLPGFETPQPVQDTFGMTPAILMLGRSLVSGRNRSTVQFATCQKTRSVWSNCAHAHIGAGDEAVMGSDGKQMHTSSSSTNTLWYGRFYEGVHCRMGDQPQPDQAISIKELHLVLEVLESDYVSAHQEHRTTDMIHIASTGLFITAGFLVGLRGKEVLLMELSSVRKHFEDGLRWKPAHVLLPLLGRFKGKTGERCFLLAVVPISKSGINIKIWMKQMIDCHALRNKRNGWVFSGTEKQNQSRISDFDPFFHDALQSVQAQRPDLIKPEVDVSKAFSLRRSLRRGSTTHARNVGVPLEIVESNNGWQKRQRAGAKAPSVSMIQHYTDVTLALPTMLQYSKNL